MSSKLARLSWTALVLGGGMIASGAALAADRSAEAILKDIESVEAPKLDASKRSDAAYLRAHRAKQEEVMAKRAALILELYKSEPDHARVPALMVERWASFRSTGSEIDGIVHEIDDVVARTKVAKFKLDALYMKALIALTQSRAKGAPDLSAMEAFLKLAPKSDPRVVDLLYTAQRAVKTLDEKIALEDRIIAGFPDSRYAAMIKGGRHQREAIGKPFDLEFTDAIGGSTVSIKGLKGKVVVIDFWATWCGPCVAEMPKMKALYAKYRDQGVEFIGVSLDQPKERGGLDKLKKFVEENKIAWPQYYQGKGWQSTFSSSLGINAIPCVFVVDTEGKLYSAEARGKLEEMIPRLLEKKGSTPGAAGAAGGE